MAITFVNNGTASTGGSAASCVITLPASLQANDIVIAQIMILEVATITPPDGTWNSIRSDGNSIQQTLFWHLVANSSESSTTATFSFTAAFKSGDCIAYRGCDTVTPINQNSGRFSNSSASFGNAAITPSVDNGMLTIFWGWNGSTTMTLSGTPTLTQRYAVTPSGGFGLIVGEVAAPSSGTAVTLSQYLCAQSPATNVECQALILAPLVAAGGPPPEMFRRSFSTIQKITYIRNLLAKPPIP